jgi:hypothetical protein
MYEYAVSYEINFFDAVRPTSMEIFLRVQEWNTGMSEFWQLGEY